jgi:hypothetical protein
VSRGATLQTTQGRGAASAWADIFFVVCFLFLVVQFLFRARAQVLAKKEKMSASVAEIRAALVMHRGDVASAAADLLASARPPGWKMNYRKNIPGRVPAGDWTNTGKKIEITAGEFVPIVYGLIRPTSTASSLDGYVYSYDDKTDAVGIIFLRGTPDADKLKIALKAVKADFAGVDSEKDLLYRHALQHWGKILPIHRNGKAEKAPKVKTMAFPKGPVFKPKTAAPPPAPRVQTGSASGQADEVPTVRVEYPVMWDGAYNKDNEDPFYYNYGNWDKTEFLLQVDTPETAALLTERLNTLHGFNQPDDTTAVYPQANWEKLVRNALKRHFTKAKKDGLLHILDIEYPGAGQDEIVSPTTILTKRVSTVEAKPLRDPKVYDTGNVVEFRVTVPYDPKFVASLAKINMALEES